MGYVSKDRDKEALILNASIRENLVLPSLKPLSRKSYISRSSERKMTDRQVKEMEIKCHSIAQYCSELSGGNKQKVVFSKWLANESDIFILDCPTAG